MEGVRFIHIRTEEDGAVTIAYKERVEGLWIVGAAFCAPTDVFNKSRGRLIAMGRLKARMARENGNGKVLNMPGSTSCHGDDPHKSKETVCTILEQLRTRPYMGDEKFPGPLWYDGFLETATKERMV